MTDDLCGHLRLKVDAAKLRGRRIGCGFGAESLTIKGEASTFLAVRRSAFGDDAPPTLTLSDGTSEVARNVDELFRGEASVVEAALDDTLKLWVEYIPAPPEPRRGDVVELEPWARGGAVLPRDGAADLAVDAAADGLVRVAWTPAPPAEPWQCNVTLPRPAVRVARRDSWADALARPAAALRDTEAGRRLAPVADDVATALAPAVAASRLAWRSVAAAATAAAARGDGVPGPYS